MAKKSATENLTSLVDSLTKKSGTPFDVTVDNSSILASLIPLYNQYSGEEKEAKAAKEKLREKILVDALSLYAQEAENLSPRLSLPASIQLNVRPLKEDAPSGQLMVTLNEKFENLTKGEELALTKAGFGHAIVSQVAISIDKVDEKLRDKIATLLMDNLTPAELAEVVSTKRSLRKDTFTNAVEEERRKVARTPIRERIIACFNILAPTTTIRSK